MIFEIENIDTIDIVECLWGTGRATKLKYVLPMYELRQRQNELIHTFVKQCLELLPNKSATEQVPFYFTSEG